MGLCLPRCMRLGHPSFVQMPMLNLCCLRPQEIQVRWQIDPDPSGRWPCAMADWQLGLAITPRDGSDPVVYSLGPAPSAIWRGDVLMRCGPAFELHGGIRPGGRYQNRVVLDGVDRFQLHQPSGLPVLQMQLEQRTRRGGRVRSQGVG